MGINTICPGDLCFRRYTIDTQYHNICTFMLLYVVFWTLHSGMQAMFVDV